MKIIQIMMGGSLSKTSTITSVKSEKTIVPPTENEGQPSVELKLANLSLEDDDQPGLPKPAPQACSPKPVPKETKEAGIKRNECVKCHEFYGTKDTDWKCSYCFAVDSGHIENITFKAVTDKTVLAPLRRQYLKDNLTKMYSIFKEIFYMDHEPVTEAKFKMLLGLLKNKSSGEVFAHLNGYRDFPATVLTSNQADRLLSQQGVSDKDSGRNEYQFIHAICPFIFDPWNIVNRNSVLLCYYKDFGELTDCPDSVASLFELWKRIRGASLTWISPFDAGDCINCEKTISSREQFVQCRKCKLFYHLKCACNKKQCQACEAEWIKEDLHKNKSLIGFNLPQVMEYTDATCNGYKIAPLFLENPRPEYLAKMSKI
jgi:hypothetical protein